MRETDKKTPNPNPKPRIFAKGRLGVYEQYYYWLSTHTDMTEKFIGTFSQYIQAVAIVNVVLKMHPQTS